MCYAKHIPQGEEPVSSKQSPRPLKPDRKLPKLQVPYPTVVSFKRVLKLLTKITPGFVIERSFLLKNRIPPTAV